MGYNLREQIPFEYGHTDPSVSFDSNDFLLEALTFAFCAPAKLTPIEGLIEDYFRN